MTSLAALEQHLLDVAAQVPRQVKTAKDGANRARVTTAREMLRDQHTTASGCFRAAEAIFGPSFRVWEPETLWVSLERDGVDVPLVNRDKLLATLTLTMIPAFWWEVNAFENTTMAFNNVVSDARVLQEATPAQLCWSVYEAELLYSEISEFEETPEFDREPAGYTAIVLNRAGYIRAPDLLSFAQDQLDVLNQGGADTSKNEIDAAWQQLKKRNLEKQEFGESALDLQLARLTATQLYVTERALQYEDDRKRLR